MKIKQMSYGLIVIIAASISSFAQADDWKGYAGAYCQAHSGANDVRRTGTGNIANFQADKTTIYCPVVRDVAAGGDDRIKLARVRLFNNNANEGGYCRLVSRTINGATFAFDHFSWTPGIKNVTATLGPLDASNWGSYSIYCRIPGVDGARKSFIRSVSLEENS